MHALDMAKTVPKHRERAIKKRKRYKNDAIATTKTIKKIINAANMLTDQSVEMTQIDVARHKIAIDAWLALLKKYLPDAVAGNNRANSEPIEVNVRLLSPAEAYRQMIKSSSAILTHDDRDSAVDADAVGSNPEGVRAVERAILT